ncbi:MAG: hypothetical protein JJU45_12980 [Acidimicrobiia bacterium]|nr:hypothetical protein [Acidimicrobiia bacterium]
MIERSRDELVTWVRELLLAGHLIDRAGMPALLSHVAPDVMAEVAIEEWRGASPLYTRRMQRLLDFVGDDVATIFKGMQLDIGAPPQFLDFRYTVHEEHHGEFQLAHCGALADVEPMGEELVHAMCHAIEDPTFPATAWATNPRATVAPVHRPPRSPAALAVNQRPHCHWTVTIDPARPADPEPTEAARLAGSMAAQLPVAHPNDSSDGRTHYRGPLEADVDLAAFSPATLVAIGEEAAVQGHLLVLSFALAVADRLGDEVADDLGVAQLAGAGGVVAGRLSAAMGEGDGLARVASVLRLHPLLRPSGYVAADVRLDDDVERLVLVLGDCPALQETMARSWPQLLVGSGEQGDAALAAVVRGVDARCEVRRMADSEHAGLGDEVAAAWEVTLGEVAHPDADPVTLTKFSTGATFVFEDR